MIGRGVERWAIFRDDRERSRFVERLSTLVGEEDSYLLHRVRYVHLNPVRARIVSDSADYRWGSH